MSGSGSGTSGALSVAGGIPQVTTLAETKTKDKDSQWYFTSEQLANSPSRRHGIDSDQELSFRQMTAYHIQETGQRLQVSQLCINTAIVYMHRFYAFHSFTHFHRNGIAAASLFLAAKVEEQPRKLEHVIKAANKCLNQPTSSTTDAYYIEQAQDLVFNENVLLQTLGFDVAIDHPHTHVVKTCHLVKACKDLAQTSYFLASNSLHLTSMCLQYKPTVVACFCIYLACKWSRWEIPQSTEGKHWFHYVDKTVTMDLLKQLTDEFIAIYEKSPARLKSKLNSIKALAQGASNRGGVSKDKKIPPEEWKMIDMMKMYHSSINTNDANTSSASLQAAAGTSYSQMQSSNEQPQQSLSGVPPSAGGALLPPPPQPQQQQQTQQMRKSDLHSSSQHRTHHNSSSSSSSSSHHHAKQQLVFPSGDVPDHKSSHKQQQQQQAFNSSSSSSSSGGLMRGRAGDHVQTSSQGIVNAGNPIARSNISSSSAARGTSLTSGVAGFPGQQSSSSSSLSSSQRQPQSQMHQLEINNYHKSSSSRERQNLPGQLAPPHAVPPTHSGSGSHKLKQDPTAAQRVITMKDGRMPAPDMPANKHGKLYPAPPPQYGSNQSTLLSGSQSGAEMQQQQQRSMMQQRSGYGSGNGQPSTPQIVGYQQQQQQQAIAARSSSSKHDPNKAISVQMQPQQQQHPPQHHHNKQPLPTDASQYVGVHEQQHHLHQQQQQQPSGMSYQEQANLLLPPPQQTHAQSTKSAAISMFSPDWNDKLLLGAAGTGSNSSYNGGAPIADAFGYKVPALATNIKDEKDIKKEKHRNSYGSSTSAAESATSALLNRQQQQQLQLKSSSSQKIKLEQSLNTNELAGTNSQPMTAAGLSGLKRPNDSSASLLTNFKQEDQELLRDGKIRKLDNIASVGYLDTKSQLQGLHSGGGLESVSGAVKPQHHQVVNGIETNPDLVRSLLKESLCTPNALLKTDPLASLSSQPPAELFDPAATTSAEKSSTLMDTEEHMSTSGGGKAEKKKKKDKHKHKEKDKDKTKERDERKKHKKDKDRHKERDSSDTSAAEHVKIKISKEKLDTMGTGGEAAMGFKIKIPKDRISGDINSSMIGGGGGGGSVAGSSQNNSFSETPALKIKISKDKLENYSSGASDHAHSSSSTHQHHQLPPSSSAHHHHHSSSSSSAATSYYSTFATTPLTPIGNSSSASHTGSSSTSHTSSSNSSSSGSSSKKKDRDREHRDKESKKSRSSHDFGKSNGSAAGGNGGGSASSAMVPPNATTAKSQNSSKIHHQVNQVNNMSQLFGESNDEDDDDDDSVDNHQQVYKHYPDYANNNKSNITKANNASFAAAPLSSSSTLSSFTTSSTSSSSNFSSSSSTALPHQVRQSNTDFGSRHTHSQQQLQAQQHFSQKGSQQQQQHQIQQR